MQSTEAIKVNTHAVVVASQRGLLRGESGMPGAWPGLAQAGSALPSYVRPSHSSERSALRLAA